MSRCTKVALWHGSDGLEKQAATAKSDPPGRPDYAIRCPSRMLGTYAFSQLISEYRGRKMGGYGSGRQGGRPTGESACRFDIDALVRAGAIKPGACVEGTLK